MKRLRRGLLLAFVLIVGGGALAYNVLFGGLPHPRDLAAHRWQPSVRITDRNGRLLYDVIDANSGRNIVLPLAQIPRQLRQATIDTEDGSFYTNPGVDVVGIVRAFWINLRGGEVLAGGSTITQQVSRNLLLGAEERGQRTLTRKLRESWLAWRVARAFSKDDILALYLNQMYYGGMAYGVEAAAQTYFGKSAADLSLAECALIVGLTQSPATYNPFVNPEAAKTRQLVVLGLMLNAGSITQEQHDLAAREPLFYATTPYPVNAPHFVALVQARLDGLFAPQAVYESGGLIVRTTLDLDWQTRAEQIIREQLTRLNQPADGGPGHNAHNAALVALDPNNGQVLALVGSPDYFDETISGAIDMAVVPRQPGSALKPVIYAAALSPDKPTPWTPATLLLDVRTAFRTHEDESYVPVNYDREEHGPVLLRTALGSSLNIPAVLTLEAVGVQGAMDYAGNLGLTFPAPAENYDLSLALGGGAVSLLDLTTAYAAFANGGFRIQPALILDVRDSSGALRYTAAPANPIQVMDARVAWLISDILSDNDARRLSFGGESVLNIGRIAAAKTGTTNDFHDNWTVGYTPDLAVGVWVGNANNEPMENVSGISGAGPIWHTFMRAALVGRPDKAFPQPSGLTAVEICALSGLLPTEACPFRRMEWFIAGTEPTTPDTFYRQVTLNRATGLLADADTPAALRQTQIVLDLPPALHPWARAQGLVLLDDLLVAGAGVGDGENAGTTTLRLIYPDPNTLFRISPALPLETQQLRLAAVADPTIRQVTFWLDETPLATMTTPPFETWWPLTPGVHRLWAEGREADGRTVRTADVSFTVRLPDEGDENGP